MITPEQQKNMVDDMEYTANRGWLYQISKFDSDMKQGLLRGVSPDRNNWNSGIVCLVSNPILQIVRPYSATYVRTRLFVDNVVNIAVDDTLYWGTEKIKLVRILNDGAYDTDDDGLEFVDIEVERAVDDTTMLTAEQEAITPIYGVFNSVGVHYVSVCRMETTEYPARFTVDLEVTG